MDSRAIEQGIYPISLQIRSPMRTRSCLYLTLILTNFDIDFTCECVHKDSPVLFFSSLKRIRFDRPCAPDVNA